MKPFDMQIFLPAPVVAQDLTQRMGTIHEFVRSLAEQDGNLRPQNWLLATGDMEGSFRYPAFDGEKASSALIAVYRERYRGESASSCRHVTLWNGEMEAGRGASIAYQFMLVREDQLEEIVLAAEDAGLDVQESDDFEREQLGDC